SGFGTVVTGTLVGGSLRVGDDLALYPAGRSLRVRGLQQHNRTVDLARPGSRTAVNVVGADRKDIARGHVIAPPRQLSPTRRLDVRLSVLASSAHPILHRSRLLLYLGTAEVPVELSLLEDDIVGPRPGAWAQTLSSPPRRHHALARRVGTAGRACSDRPGGFSPCEPAAGRNASRGAAKPGWAGSIPLSPRGCPDGARRPDHRAGQ